MWVLSAVKGCKIILLSVFGFWVLEHLRPEWIFLVWRLETNCITSRLEDWIHGPWDSLRSSRNQLRIGAGAWARTGSLSGPLLAQIHNWARCCTNLLILQNYLSSFISSDLLYCFRRLWLWQGRVATKSVFHPTIMVVDLWFGQCSNVSWWHNDMTSLPVEKQTGSEQVHMLNQPSTDPDPGLFWTRGACSLCGLCRYSGFPAVQWPKLYTENSKVSAGVWMVARLDM